LLANAGRDGLLPEDEKGRHLNKKRLPVMDSLSIIF